MKYFYVILFSMPFRTKVGFLLMLILPICHVAPIGLPLVGCSLYGTEHLAARSNIYISKQQYIQKI